MKQLFFTVLITGIAFSLYAQSRREAGTSKNELLTHSNVKIKTEEQKKSLNKTDEINELILQTSNNSKVILNKKTGVVLEGFNVKIFPVFISYGTLKLNIKSSQNKSQSTNIQNDASFFNKLFTINEQGNNSVSLPFTSDVKEVSEVLKSLKITPTEVIGVFQEIKKAGAMKAELVII
jgi:flagellar P-ring protein FlgI